MVRHKFSKNIHLAPWPTASGTYAVARGARCRQEWALSPNAKRHVIRILTPLGP
jgi:hypothetical protein